MSETTPANKSYLSRIQTFSMGGGFVDPDTKHNSCLILKTDKNHIIIINITLFATAFTYL
jgi:hypothetical protein